MEKLMLAMSGGVDSSAALILLKEKYDVIGATLMLNDSGDENDDSACGSSRDITDAQRVAEIMEVPHLVYDMREYFSDTVKKSFVDSYLSGETPNPCVNCNEIVKFGALLEKAKEQGCKYLATGHYARVEYDEQSGRYLLKKALLKDGTVNPKDQSYVLYRLSQEQLSAAVFPLGSMEKSEIRELALSKGLVSAGKPDSQDICFVPEGCYGDFIEKRIGSKYPEGAFCDTDGKVIGRHKGVIHYTIGQRRGIGVGFGKPVYVISKDAKTNTVVLGDNNQLFCDTITARELNMIALTDKEFSCKAKTRYKQTEQSCRVTIEGDRATVIFDEPIRAVTPGQHIVFYDGDTVLGGGVIC